MHLNTGLALLIGILATTVSATESATNATSGKVRLFLLDGQSNMARLKPDESFTPFITKAFSNDIVLVQKKGHEAQEIAKWIDMSGAKAKGVGFYKELIDGATVLLNGRRPDSVCFVWMQGESDAMSKPQSDIYERSLLALIALVREDIGGEKMTVVIGRINDWTNRTWNGNTFAEWDRIRAIQVKVGTDDPRAAWVDTDDLNDPQNDAHMVGKDGYLRLGRRFAHACTLLLNDKKPEGPVADPK